MVVFGTGRRDGRRRGLATRGERTLGPGLEVAA